MPPLEIIHLAAAYLEQFNYRVLETRGRTRVCDLIAFSQHKILFIVVRRAKSRQPIKQIIGSNKAAYNYIRKVETPHCIEKQFWIYQDGTFTLYQIHPHGVMKVDLSHQST